LIWSVGLGATATQPVSSRTAVSQIALSRNIAPVNEVGAECL